MSFLFQNERADIKIDAYGAMTTFCFHTADGDISPMYEPNWEPTDDDFLNHIAGDFLATPFGNNLGDLSLLPQEWKITKEPFDEEQNYEHGYSAHSQWSLKETLPNGLLVENNVPVGPVENVTRTVTLSDQGFSINVEDRLTFREDAAIPVAIHPIFKLPEEAEAAELILPDYEEIRTFPFDIDASSKLIPDVWASDPHRVPAKNDQYVDITKLPLPMHAEDVVMLCGINKPECTLYNKIENYKVRITWDSEEFKNCVLWFSNKGRTHQPWNGKTLCVGIEPATSAFGLGSIIGTQNNPINQKGYSTIRYVKKDEILVLRHTIELV